ncbi:hypothetical protein [Planctomicrobium piriforme]|uniref:Uncharacterized protein n=1 Tax=Planctomicrobium piriforme TaxID=1576369 RepID=A0A1I3L255_9PLAN|nr:hypothetical protein [Planctomicrobium piriforme]SFI78688.1 hypothetical protein SAMN05421753_112113 [Planctomicrobium piriforme]
MPAISVNSLEHGPLTIPTTSINIVRRGANGKAVIVLQNGNELTTRDEYSKLSEHMTSVQVWGSVTTEQA